MKKSLILFVLVAIVLSVLSCSDYNKIYKNASDETRYEVAKKYYQRGDYGKAASILESIVIAMKGSEYAEESLFLLAMTYYNQEDYVTASHYFKRYYTTYPRAMFVEQARFICAKGLYLDTPEPRLDQTSTYAALEELLLYVDLYPESVHKDEAQEMINSLQDKLVEKDYLAAQLYYNLGNYMGNNYQACVVTAQNALRDYPFSIYREDLSFLVLKAKYQMAVESVEDKKIERYRDAVDEYYSFINDFPESKYMKDANNIFKQSSKYTTTD